MVISKFDRFVQWFGLLTVAAATVSFILLFKGGLHGLVILFLYFIAVAPIVETCILHWPWIRLWKPHKEGTDYAVWFLAFLFAMSHVLVRAFVFGGWYSGYSSVFANATVQVLSFMISFAIGLWVNKGCRKFMQAKEPALAFVTTVGRHALLNCVGALIAGYFGSNWVAQLILQFP
jgi:uncharacterized membrane protein YjjP (DUF1212 family)